MRLAILLCLGLCASMALSRGLDLRLFQYPVEDARKSAQSAYPTFAAYVVGDGKEKQKRIPGVSAEHLKIAKKKYRIKVMNEYRLYDMSQMSIDEKILLERYCTRYNRELVISLGL